MAWQDTALYFPPKDAWEQVSPEQAGFDPDRLQAAIEHAQSVETLWPHDLNRPVDDIDEPPPYNEKIGPLKPRGTQSGVIVKDGYLVAEWGEPDRVDMTFSATKSYLSLCLGLAHDQGLIPNLQAPVRELVDDGGFEPPHNHHITWHMLFQQTSEWSGELWDKPDWLDHHRHTEFKGTKRTMKAPGAHWEYNDVRVNRASLALLRVFRQPLPEILDTHLMTPTGCSDTWEWHGYRNSQVTIDGCEMQSVSGGGHWGGGLFINSYDHARVGYLLLRQGEWKGRKLISKRYLDQALTPCPLNPNYGYMFWLNGPQDRAPSAPSTSFFMSGAGSNMVWVDPEHHLVVVLRWIQRERVDAAYAKILQALTG
jgi:CubicO group peptidase (beta-lactamase class C family)